MFIFSPKSNSTLSFHTQNLWNQTRTAPRNINFACLNFAAFVATRWKHVPLWRDPENRSLWDPQAMFRCSPDRIRGNGSDAEAETKRIWTRWGFHSVHNTKFFPFLFHTFNFFFKEYPHLDSDPDRNLHATPYNAFTPTSQQKQRRERGSFHVRTFQIATSFHAAKSQPSNFAHKEHMLSSLLLSTPLSLKIIRSLDLLLLFANPQQLRWKIWSFCLRFLFLPIICLI